VDDHQLWTGYGEAVRTALGFFWKAGWAFVMGYAISAMIQSFVPKRRLTRHMGDAGAKSVGLATAFGAASSSCSFAALAAARSLVLKGAHFVAAVAFMFASTNLVIELGVLILIFLGWQYLAAEIVGGLLLIVLSSLLIRWTYPRRWLEAAREKVEEEAPEQEEDFSPLDRLRSREGWYRVGHQFVGEWKMVWQEILVGFTVAGFMKVFVPHSFWRAVFLMDLEGQVPQVLLTLENAIVAPFVACLTFIGSMGNIPLAAVLAGNGVAFAGIMGFIYSDLMVPPLVKVNARYYGWRVALYIAGVMFVAIVLTAMILHWSFAAGGIVPETTGTTTAGPETRFAIDYTFWFNLFFAVVAVLLYGLHRRHLASAGEEGMEHGESRGVDVQLLVTWLFIALLAGGVVALVTS